MDPPILKDFALENLDNLSKAPGATVNLGNILFDGDRTIQDSFDVFNAEDIRKFLFNRNTVTFLNDLDNVVFGFNDDVINGQGGNDRLFGLGGHNQSAQNRAGHRREWQQHLGQTCE